MHGPMLAALLAAALGFGPAPDNPPTAAETITRARALLAKDDPRAAAALLQDALPTAGADLGPMIVVLRQAYARAADQAAKAGRNDEAEEYRENLQILNRKMRGKPADARSKSESADVERPAPISAPRVAPHAEPPRPDPMPALPTNEAPPTPEPIGGLDAPTSPSIAPEAARSDPLTVDPKPVGRAAAPRDPSLTRAASVPPATGVSSAEVGGLDGASAAPTDSSPSPGGTAILPGQGDFPASRDARPTPIDAAAAPGAPDAAPPSASPAPPHPVVGRASPPAQYATAPGRDARPTGIEAGAGPGQSTASPALQPFTPAPAAADPIALPAPSGPTAADVLKAADTAYLKGLYLDANAQYAALAKAGKLPDDRKPHWAYCRSADVLRRIKAKPSTKDEWLEIHREIAAIKALNPKYWYAEYLKNLATEEAKTAVKPPKGRVVRGAMPDESPARPSNRPARPGPFAMAVPSGDTPPVITSQGDSSRWKVRDSANFVIFHDDPALADRVAEAAELARDAIVRKWTGSAPPRAWSPKCELYLYPNATIFAGVTGQPPESPGFSTMESNGAAVTGRRIKLRADASGLVAAVVPHEVTHVVLADLFPARQIPRWADEGISVLSEPAPEQERRVGDLDAALNGGRIFSVESLMVNDYPEGKYWPLYYAQSVSLTRFLVDQGKPGQLIDFLRGSQRDGVEPELRRVYGFESYADLQKRWLAYAKQSSAARVAARGGDSRTR